MVILDGGEVQKVKIIKELSVPMESDFFFQYEGWLFFLMKNEEYEWYFYNCKGRKFRDYNSYVDVSGNLTTNKEELITTLIAKGINVYSIY